MAPHLLDAISGRLSPSSTDAERPIRDAAFYRALVEGMNEGVLVRDGAGVITYASPQFQQMLGYTVEELVGARAEHLLLPEERERWAQTLAASASGVPQTFEHQLVRKDGSVAWVLVSRRPVLGPDGVFRGSVALVSDVTEARRTARQVQELAEGTAPLTGEALFRAAVQHLAEALDLKAVFAAECVDYPTTRVRILAEWDRGRFTEPREFALAGTACDATIAGARINCLPDNLRERFPKYAVRERVSYLGVPLFDTAGDGVIGHLALWGGKPIRGAEIVDHPIFRVFASRIGAELRRKRAEEQARLHLQQLAHVTRLSSMGEMASAIAHEVNQPLTAVVNYSRACIRLLRSGRASADEIVGSMEQAAAQAERASQIIRHLRSFVRKDDAQLGPVELNYLVTEAVRLVQPEARQSTVEIATELGDGLPRVLADNIQIQQVLVNLVRNAVEAINGADPERREVRVGTRRGPEDTVEAWVEDSGPGFDDRMAEKVFQPFFSTKAEGMGIGLAISRSIVEAHHGRIWATSEPGRGARFCLALPAAA